MKESSYIIIVLSLYSCLFSLCAGLAISANVVKIERVGIGLLILAIVQVIIAIIAACQKNKAEGEEDEYQ